MQRAAISGETQICGVIGHPVRHTASPMMHNTGYEKLGLNYRYMAFDVAPDQLGAAMAGIRALGIVGLNVTIPHKEAVIPYLDELDGSAKRVQAVNTIVNRNGRLIGYNTDGAGFIDAFQAETTRTLQGKSVILIGAGGAAKGIAWALIDAGIAALTILNRSLEKAQDLQRQIQSQLSNVQEVPITIFPLNQCPDALITEADILINTTPIGMGDTQGQSPFSRWELITAHHLCCDIIYKPAMTAFLHAAQEKGAQILGGAGMLAGQGRLSFEKFTGHHIDYATFRNVL